MLNTVLIGVAGLLNIHKQGVRFAQMRNLAVNSRPVWFACRSGLCFGVNAFNSMQYFSPSSFMVREWSRYVSHYFEHVNAAIEFGYRKA